MSIQFIYSFNIAVFTETADLRDYDKKRKAAQLQPFSKNQKYFFNAISFFPAVFLYVVCGHLFTIAVAIFR